MLHQALHTHGAMTRLLMLTLTVWMIGVIGLMLIGRANASISGLKVSNLVLAFLPVHSVDAAGRAATNERCEERQKFTE